MRALLLSAYEARSHAYWRSQLCSKLTDIDWHCLCLPPRFFAWRVRGNPLSWWPELNALSNEKFAFILATSMVDLATIKGLHPALARTPALLYFHENQFAFPATAEQASHLEAQMVSLYSALAAQQLWFNSTFNQRSFFAGLSTLLKRFPDRVPGQIVPSLLGQSQCMPVPLALDLPTLESPRLDWPPVLSGPSVAARPLRLVWNHRWEYDKGPELLWGILQELQRRDYDFELFLLGEQFRRQPPVMESILKAFADRCLVSGFVESRADYLAYLAKADIVLSTAEQDFQGLAVQEAICCGALPWVPDDLAYPEYVPALCRYPRLDSVAKTARAAVDTLQRLLALPALEQAQLRRTINQQLAPYTAERLIPAYAKGLQQLAEAG